LLITKHAPSAHLLAAGLSGFVCHGVAAAASATTLGLMHGFSHPAERVLAVLAPWRAGFLIVVFSFMLAFTAAYLWPIARHVSGDPSADAPLRVRRRTLSAPLVLATLSFCMYLVAPIYYAAVVSLAQLPWPPDLTSFLVFRPLTVGFLAATSNYLLAEWLLRRGVVPAIFPNGGLSDVRGAAVLGVRARLAILVTAVAFTPVFTLVGLVASARMRVAAGLDAHQVVEALLDSTRGVFVFYMLLTFALTLLVARSLTRPLGRMAAAVRTIQSGELALRVPVDSNDEIGTLADGVNTMAATLRDRDHILATFGRIVEPDVRDRLLSGRLEVGGDSRLVTILFADLRGFTGLAEVAEPRSVVQTLNEFFSLMSDWVHACGGYVDKFIGDAMLVVFGLFDDGGDAQRSAARGAIRCAHGMRERLAELNRERAQNSRTALRMGVGIHSGEVMAGTIGARDRHDYTVIGDAVNVASRLQELCRSGADDVLISSETFRTAALAPPGSQPSAANVPLRGRSRTVDAYHLPQDYLSHPPGV